MPILIAESCRSSRKTLFIQQYSYSLYTLVYLFELDTLSSTLVDSYEIYTNVLSQNSYHGYCNYQ